MRRLPAVICLLLLVGVTGCFQAPKPVFPETVPVNGQVTLDGNPLDGATVIFTGASPGVASAMGITDDSGQYELNVYVGPNKKPGAQPGNYKVHISTMLPPPVSGQKPDADGPAIVMERVPEQYTRLDKTPLKATVPDDGGAVNFELKSK